MNTKNNVIYKIIIYYILLYGLLINHAIGISGMMLFIIGLIVYIIIPLIFLAKLISKYKKWSYKNLGKVASFSYIIFFPVIHILSMEAFLAGHEGVSLELFIFSGAFSGIFSFGGCAIGIAMNAVYRSYLHKK